MTEPCELLSLLNHVQQCMAKEIEEALKEQGLSLAKYNILKELDAEGGRLPFSILVERLGCVRSNVTGLIDRLQEDQLVRRVDHPEDRRMLFAELTDEGRRIFCAVQPRYDAAIVRLFNVLSEADREKLGQLLHTLA